MEEPLGGGNAVSNYEGSDAEDRDSLWDEADAVFNTLDAGGGELVADWPALAGGEGQDAENENPDAADDGDGATSCATNEVESIPPSPFIAMKNFKSARLRFNVSKLSAYNEKVVVGDNVETPRVASQMKVSPAAAMARKNRIIKSSTDINPKMTKELDSSELMARLETWQEAPAGPSVEQLSNSGLRMPFSGAPGLPGMRLSFNGVSLMSRLPSGTSQKSPATGRIAANTGRLVSSGRSSERKLLMSPIPRRPPSRRVSHLSPDREPGDDMRRGLVTNREHSTAFANSRQSCAEPLPSVDMKSSEHLAPHTARSCGAERPASQPPLLRSRQASRRSLEGVNRSGYFKYVVPGAEGCEADLQPPLPDGAAVAREAAAAAAAAAAAPKQGRALGEDAAAATAAAYGRGGAAFAGAMGSGKPMTLLGGLMKAFGNKGIQDLLETPTGNKRLISHVRPVLKRIGKQRTGHHAMPPPVGTEEDFKPSPPVGALSPAELEEVHPPNKQMLRFINSGPKGFHGALAAEAKQSLTFRRTVGLPGTTLQKSGNKDVRNGADLLDLDGSRTSSGVSRKPRTSRSSINRGLTLSSSICEAVEADPGILAGGGMLREPKPRPQTRTFVFNLNGELKPSGGLSPGALPAEAHLVRAAAARQAKLAAKNGRPGGRPPSTASEVALSDGQYLSNHDPRYKWKFTPAGGVGAYMYVP